MSAGNQVLAGQKKAEVRVDCGRGCLRDELEESEIRNEGGDDGQNVCQQMPVELLMAHINGFADSLTMFLAHCTRCKKFSNVRVKRIEFEATLKEAREILAAKQKKLLVEQ